MIETAMVMVSWGRSALLRRTLESLRATKPKKLPGVIVDNGSGPATIDLLHATYEDLNFDLNAWTKNNGKPEALNWGAGYVIHRGDPEFLLFCDSDIEFLPGWYEKLISAFRGFSSDSKRLGALSAYAHGTSKKTPENGSEAVQLRRYSPGCALLMPTKIFQEIGPFDESRKIWGIDTDYFKRMAKAGYVNGTIWPESVVLHTGADQRTFDPRNKNAEPIYHE